MESRCFLGLLILLALVGCDSGDSNETMTVTISSTPPLCPPSNESRTLCPPALLDESGVQHGTTRRIVNFNYEFGTEYQLLLEVVKLTDPPADGLDVEYRILEVLKEARDPVDTIYSYEQVSLTNDAFVFVREGVYSLPPFEFLCADDVDCDTLAAMANSGGVVAIELTMTGGEIPVTVTNWN
ncbi:DUF4377 domain-containing protein [Aliidiomarina halalkaliphila]|uniref:DUF4377 domain-containing protein n=1 Tax=Aliidiomarina halalkaliphila TaxID=2593535 RepID=A0A552X1V5_9GAMM|nr:DUF4377 domain-containing protein [Aliidiomarina halalkaliphila]TRW48955.1 DUF4377 domain-containing protein [Aliidiomarina halalkaliphila]